MKKIVMTALAMLMLCMLAGCPEAKDDKPTSMTFVDNLAAPAKEFTIDSKFNFQVTFITPNAIEAGMMLQPGDVIKGKIQKPDAAWDKNLTGEAAKMSSTNTLIHPVVETLEVPLSLDYTETAGAISAVKLKFIGFATTIVQAQNLMGGDYYRK